MTERVPTKPRAFATDLGRVEFQPRLPYRVSRRLFPSEMQCVMRHPAARALRLLLPRLRHHVPAAKIMSKPGKEELTVLEHTIGFVVLTASMMLPSSYVLAHLVPYRRGTKFH
ncbi:cytochrome c oxidase subunit 8B [Narcine bancroftii]|uniref:cytochrome c oxidase subunit 8B n=1 Tax=Narcine bancroftii TaxID=1343680 RepID=UPI00383109B6